MSNVKHEIMYTYNGKPITFVGEWRVIKQHNGEAFIEFLVEYESSLYVGESYKFKWIPKWIQKHILRSISPPMHETQKIKVWANALCIIEKEIFTNSC